MDFLQARRGGPAAQGGAPLRVETLCSARGAKAMRYAEPGHRQSGGLFVPGEGPGHWPVAACKAWPPPAAAAARVPRPIGIGLGQVGLAHEPGQPGVGADLGVLDEAGRMLLHQAIAAWCIPSGGARCGQERHPTPAGTAGRWRARKAPEAPASDGLEPRAAPQSLGLLPTGVCLPLRGPFRVFAWVQRPSPPF
jgi:hypothetical protein